MPMYIRRGLSSRVPRERMCVLRQAGFAGTVIVTACKLWNAPGNFHYQNLSCPCTYVVAFRPAFQEARMCVLRQAGFAGTVIVTACKLWNAPGNFHYQNLSCPCTYVVAFRPAFQEARMC